MYMKKVKEHKELTNILSKVLAISLQLFALRQSMICLLVSVGQFNNFACRSARYFCSVPITTWDIGEALIAIARWNNPAKTSL